MKRKKRKRKKEKRKKKKERLPRRGEEKEEEEMIKVLDYFNLGDIYKFLPDYQREGIRSRSQSIGEPDDNGLPRTLSSNGEGGNGDKWLLLNVNPQAQKPEAAPSHNRSSSGSNLEFPTGSGKTNVPITTSGSPLPHKQSPDASSSSSSSVNLRIQELVGSDVDEDEEDDDEDGMPFGDNSPTDNQASQPRATPNLVQSNPVGSPRKDPSDNDKFQSASPSSPVIEIPKTLQDAGSNALVGIGEGEVVMDMDDNYFGMPTDMGTKVDLPDSQMVFSLGKNVVTSLVKKLSSLKTKTKIIDENENDGDDDDGKDEMVKENEIDNDENDENDDEDDDGKDELVKENRTNNNNANNKNISVYDDKIEDVENLRMLYLKTCPNVSITVVGQEPNGVLLICVHARDKTFLNLFEIKVMEMTCLCTWNGKVDVVCATVDDARKVVAVSIKSSISVSDVLSDKKLSKLYQEVKGEGNDMCTVYSTFVECVNDTTGKKPWVGERSFHPQEVHFTCSPRRDTLQLVHITLSVSIVTYTIRLGSPVFSKILYIKNKPRMHTVVAGKYLWSRYDHRYKVVHCIAFREEDSCLEFNTVSLKKPMPKMVVKCPMSSFFGIKKNDFFSPNWAAYPLPYIVGAINEHPPPPLPCITTVVLPLSQSICVCVQHDIDIRSPDSYFIPVSIVPVNLRTRIDYSIPIPRDTANAENIRVLFGNIADFLMIFIPGTYLHLLDISSTHNPGPGVILTGEDTMSFVAKIGKAESRWKGAPLAALNLSYYVNKFGSPRLMLNHTFLDMRTGVICELSINKKSIDKLIELGVSFPKILHIAMLHVRDDDLVDYVVRRVLEGPPRHITPEFFKEYIIGQTFLSVQKHFPYKLLLGTPSTLVDQDKDLFVNHLSFKAYLIG